MRRDGVDCAGVGTGLELGATEVFVLLRVREGGRGGCGC